MTEMQLPTTETIELMSPKELIQTYNYFAPTAGQNPVKRFETRGVGIKRLTAVADALRARGVTEPAPAGVWPLIVTPATAAPVDPAEPAMPPSKGAQASKAGHGANGKAVGTFTKSITTVVTEPKRIPDDVKAEMAPAAALPKKTGKVVKFPGAVAAPKPAKELKTNPASAVKLATRGVKATRTGTAADMFRELLANPGKLTDAEIHAKVEEAFGHKIPKSACAYYRADLARRAAK